VSSSTWTAEPAARTGRAFGLSIDADFEIPGLRPGHDGRSVPGVILRLADNEEIAAVWRSAGATRIGAEASTGGEIDRTVDVHPELGYRIYARDFGLCLVAPDGSRLLCSPPSASSWRWHRLLLGRCLPLAALLRGYEVIHAGGVVLDDRVLAITGPTGAGKTSLTLRLMLADAGFFTDDVLALELADGELLAHPGLGVINVRTAEHERLDRDSRGKLGDLLERTGQEKLHYAVRPAPGALPLGALYFLTDDGDEASPAIRPVTAPDPRRLLTTAFVHEVRTPKRLARLLDVCAGLSAATSMFDVPTRTGEDAAALAARIRLHFRERVRR
jgi:hypothetical protein